MIQSYFINLIFIFALNVIFFISGICLNALVLVSFWKSIQLRKKLCYFMIMVLSCCDLLVVLTNHPLLALIAMLWLAKKPSVYPNWVHISLGVFSSFLGFSLLALLVMNINRYLAISYPLYHRRSITKRKLLTVLGILIIVDGTLTLMNVNDLVLSNEEHALILFAILSPPMLFTNYKLFKVVWRNRRNINVRKSFSLKAISSCLLAVACFYVVSIPVFVYIGLKMTSKVKKFTLDQSHLLRLWVRTITAMNATFNCLIFYWKNKTLRTEGVKVIRSIKVYRRDQF